MRFIDEVSFFIASGDGGDGCVSFRRERFVPRGGPDGGDGGRGGSLIFEASPRRNTLVDFRRNKVYRARDGRPGAGRNCYGAKGADLHLLVPVGTMLFDEDSGELLADLNEAGATWVLPGGRGGQGNVHFKSATRRTPYYASPGEPGVELRVRAELKLIADVGLLGFPNAGKSTLISRISAARPKIAEYPFTTLVPSLGVVEPYPGRGFVVADIPGLIEGAADGVGLGHRFLRHVERCTLYIHLLPPDSPEGGPLALLRALNHELERYDPALLDRQQIVVLSKRDLLDEAQLREILDSLERETGSRPLAISAATGEGLSELVGRCLHALEPATEATDPAGP